MSQGTIRITFTTTHARVTVTPGRGVEPDVFEYRVSDDGMQRLMPDTLDVDGIEREFIDDLVFAAMSAYDTDGPIKVWEPMTRSEVEVLGERGRQRRKWGDEHDDREHEMPAFSAAAQAMLRNDDGMWPFEGGALPSAVLKRNGRREQVVRACAFLIAGLDQQDRAGGG